MKALWIHVGADGLSVVKPLPIPYRHIVKPIDPEIFRRQARGEDVGRPRLHSGTGLRSRRTVGRHDDQGPVVQGRGLIFVVSGQVELTASVGSVQVVGPGDVYFQDDLQGAAHRAVCVGDCRLLHLGVDDAWKPEGELQTQVSETRVEADGKPLLRRMYKAADEKSYFKDFADLFSTLGHWSEPRWVVGFHFVHFPPGFFIDWHPEGVNNFVIVMTGALELEVGGDGTVEVFGPGDVCLAEDRTGEGHIDRVHGENRMTLIVFEDAQLWPRNE